MRIYFDAYGWIDASSASVATLVTYEFVATVANQTTFTGNDANGVLLSYTVGSEVVIGNGAKLKRGVDYTASNGSSIVLTEGVGVGQEISVLAFGSFLVANTYMKSEADARFVNATGDTITGDLQIAGAKLDLRSAPGDTNGLKAWMDLNGIGYINAGYSVSDLELQTAGITRIKADRNGRITMPYQPMFSGYRNTSPTTVSSGVVIHNIAMTDVGSCYNASNGRFTCPVAGKYLVTINGHAENTAPIRHVMRKNAIDWTGEYSSGPAGHYGAAGRTAIITCAAGDYIDHYVVSGPMWCGDTTGLSMTVHLIG